MRGKTGTCAPLADFRSRAPCCRSLRHNGDNAGAAAGTQPIGEQVCEQERRKVIDGKRSLNAVDRQLSARKDRAGVIDQHINPIQPAKFFDRGANLRLIRKVDEHDQWPLATTYTSDVRAGTFRARGITTQHDGPRTLRGERLG